MIYNENTKKFDIIDVFYVNLRTKTTIKLKSQMVENIIEILENTFLTPFHDELDAAKLYNILYGQSVDDSI